MAHTRPAGINKGSNGIFDSLGCARPGPPGSPNLGRRVQRCDASSLQPCFRWVLRLVASIPLFGAGIAAIGPGVCEHRTALLFTIVATVLPLGPSKSRTGSSRGQAIRVLPPAATNPMLIVIVSLQAPFQAFVFQGRGGMASLDKQRPPLVFQFGYVVSTQCT